MHGDSVEKSRTASRFATAMSDFASIANHEIHPSLPDPLGFVRLLPFGRRRHFIYAQSALVAISATGKIGRIPQVPPK
jgi:hypothetical protein